ncbi:hypothetical protein K440DRAFT_659612 [Wilcoxina mikolae CBS 423.85]|nr:hypothetical protein K440DRAFT_659612 [Wilcoxina mikolae CBS 423.85]
MSSVVDSKETIHTTFQQEHRAIELLLDKLRSVPASERPSIIDDCLSGISRLSDLLKDASSYLPAYDQRTYSLKVKTLSDQLAQIRQSLAPKQKFTFKSRRNNAATIGGAVDIGPINAPTQLNSAAQKAASEQENLVITSQASVHIRPTALTTTASASLLLSSLKDCVVTLSESIRFSSAAVKNVEGSLLLLGGVVNGPIHLTSVSNSILVFCCRQFRMHDAKNVDVYLHCTSRPIIEDCEGIRFHPYGAEGGNMWQEVDDFKWLRSEKSPHWSASPSTEDTNKKWKDIEGKSVGEIEVKQVLDDLLRSRQHVTQ